MCEEKPFMKLKTNLVAAFLFAFCFAAIPNLGGCDKNGETTTTNNPATKPSSEHTEVTQHADGSTDTKQSKTVNNGDGTVTHTEKTTKSP
jgi:hypothetical protein